LLFSLLFLIDTDSISPPVNGFGDLFLMHFFY